MDSTVVKDRLTKYVIRREAGAEEVSYYHEPTGLFVSNLNEATVYDICPTKFTLDFLSGLQTNGVLLRVMECHIEVFLHT